MGSTTIFQSPSSIASSWFLRMASGSGSCVAIYASYATAPASCSSSPMIRLSLKRAVWPGATKGFELRAALFPRRLGRRERLLEVGQQVSGVLDPAGQPHQGVGDTEGFALSTRLVPVRHQRGHFDQRLDTPETRGDIGDAAAVDKTHRAFEVTVELETHDPAKALHRSRRGRVVGVALEPWVPHASHTGVGLEHAGDPQAVLVVTRHAK